ncbi:type I restriction-modification enzyme R subunit C-terminal domain-containing protein [Chloroflexota bacterium]
MDIINEVLGYLATILTIVAVMFLLFIVLLVILMVSPKTPNKGTLLALIGGPLVYIYVGKWGKAIFLSILTSFTGGIAYLFIWPYSMINIRSDVRTYHAVRKTSQASEQKLDLEIQKLKRESINPQITRVEPAPVVTSPSRIPSPEPLVPPITRQFSLFLNVSGEGITVPEVGKHQFKEGTTIYINASPSEGWQFAGWIGEVEDSYSPGTMININTDKNVTATFTSVNPTLNSRPINPPPGITINQQSSLPKPEIHQREEANISSDRSDGEPARQFVDGGKVGSNANLVHKKDGPGKQPHIVKFLDRTSKKVRSMGTSAGEIRSQWASAEQRVVMMDALTGYGINLEQLSEYVGQPDADPVDLLCHVAFNTPIITRRERVERLRKDHLDFWGAFRAEANQVLNEILDKYIEYGTSQFKIPDILKTNPISQHGNVVKIAAMFGGVDYLRQAIKQMQMLLYIN